ncbi:hypothetical protein [Nocardioides sp. B-3]|uniref:hypothetical protein n=1 Tax=Nocardioides sp. B-3 TaxID=2895565 RepID=UPI0021528B63|nr:hypothetical protein [Nocardioides sp. B-3]UUZ57862.1 hypothetical protein LP418_15905 [Nocardioides sp. B-3]
MIVVYEISNGISTSRATLRVDTADDFKNPPVVFDSFGRADDSDRVAVDVLGGAYDPDGTVADLKVAEVYAAEGAATVNGSTIKVTRGADPIVVPFRVEDADGAAATASLYVPPTGTGIPYVKPGAEIMIDEGARPRASSRTTSSIRPEERCG